MGGAWEKLVNGILNLEQVIFEVAQWSFCPPRCHCRKIEELAGHIMPVLSLWHWFPGVIIHLGWVYAEKKISTESKCVQQQDMLRGDCSCFWWGHGRFRILLSVRQDFLLWGLLWSFFIEEVVKTVVESVPVHPSIILWVKHAGWAMEERGNVNILQCNTFITAFKKEAQGTIGLWCCKHNEAGFLCNQSASSFTENPERLSSSGFSDDLLLLMHFCKNKQWFLHWFSLFLKQLDPLWRINCIYQQA